MWLSLAREEATREAHPRQQEQPGGGAEAGWRVLGALGAAVGRGWKAMVAA